jgi:hypothetical protein
MDSRKPSVSNSGAQSGAKTCVTAASARHDEARGWGYRGVWAGVARVYTGVAVRSCGEARKGLRLAVTRAPRGGAG